MLLVSWAVGSLVLGQVKIRGGALCIHPEPLIYLNREVSVVAGHPKDSLVFVLVSKRIVDCI